MPPVATINWAGTTSTTGLLITWRQSLKEHGIDLKKDRTAMQRLKDRLKAKKELSG